jgi:uncharacterized protein (DUF433 family)
LWAYSFLDLLSLAVVAVLRQRGVRRAGIRRAIDYLEREYEVPRPLAHKKVVKSLATAGTQILWRDEVDVTAGGQMALKETIETYLRPVDYGRDSMAQRWHPSRSVLLDPEIQAGRPCISGTRVTTDTVASRMSQGEEPRTVAADLQITARQVGDAVRFENRLLAGQGLALVA